MKFFFVFLFLPIILSNLTCSVPLFALEIETIQGVYKHRFKNGLIDGSKYESEDILEVVKYNDSSIYFRTVLNFFNGHLCTLSGIASQKDNKFTYKDADSACRVSITETKQELVMNEDSDGKCREYCGARGTLNNIHFQKSWRRKIRYMPLILKSYEYQNAIENYSWAVEPQLKKTFWPNGNLKTQESIVKDVKHGLYKAYRENGSLLEETTYVKGGKFGVSRTYLPNGKVESYSDYFGENRIYFSAQLNENGLVTEVFHDGDGTVKCLKPVAFSESAYMLVSRCKGTLD